MSWPDQLLLLAPYLAIIIVLFVLIFVLTRIIMLLLKERRTDQIFGQIERLNNLFGGNPDER